MLTGPSLSAVVGEAPLREYLGTSLPMPRFSISWPSTDFHFSPDGSLACMFGRNAITINGADGLPTTTASRGFTIWRREPDGVWKCAVDIWNAEPAA